MKYNIKYNLTFERAFFGDYKTTFALFGETRIGRPYSWTMQDASNQRSPIFGTTGGTSRYLLYVPTGIDDARVSYDTVQTRDTLNALINATGLNKYRGQIAPRNAFNSKWFTKIDLHLAQEIPTGLGASRIRCSGCRELREPAEQEVGSAASVQLPYTIAAVRAQCLTAPVATGTAAGSAVATNTSQGCAQYRYLAPNSTPTDTISSQESLYQIRIGARFSF